VEPYPTGRQVGPSPRRSGGPAARTRLRPALSGRDIRDLVAKIKATKVKAVFSETSLPPRAAETIAREAGVKVVEGADALYGDALGPAGSDGDTYLKMIRHNTRTIVNNLSGALSGLSRQSASSVRVWSSRCRC
jgi:hypothetical protein